MIRGALIVLIALALPSAVSGCGFIVGAGAQLDASLDPLVLAGDDSDTLSLRTRGDLLEVADRGAALGPAGPDLDESLTAAQELLRRDRADGPAAWRAARALYLASVEGDPSDLDRTAARCMVAAQLSLAHDLSAESPYFAALCYGLRAQTRSRSAVGLVQKMVELGESALSRDPMIQNAGPHRLLGGVYLRAPAWPTSVGDLDSALDHLASAVELSPEWPENHLLLAEALLEDECPVEAMEALNAAKEHLSSNHVRGWRATFSQQHEQLLRQTRAKLPADRCERD